MRDHCRAIVQGRDEVIDLVLTALFADGHVLLEDHPGAGTTTLACALGNCLARPDRGRIASFRRIQLTPDLLPADVTGAAYFRPQTGTFTFRPGPLFANVVLADEINRASRKVQAALLAAMAEKQVTVGNHPHALEPLFFVIATQDRLTRAGTHPLRPAQRDRFLFRLGLPSLPREAELDVLDRWKAVRRNPPRLSVTPARILEARAAIQERVAVSALLHECLVDVARALRWDRRVARGISTRSLVQAIPALQVRALLQGRAYVTPLDLKALAKPLFAHRLELLPGTWDAETVVRDCVGPVVEKASRRGRD
jgi:MoxR-like ATPase